ncbi:MAG: hypothetical protein P8L69_06880, partial [Alphaproteobacteria bacterium]|nr:hypothetical protein [Alphaproteobacteria bacterium]
MNDSDAMSEKLEKEDIKAIVVDEYIINKGKTVYAEELFKNYMYKVPIIFLLEALNEKQGHHQDFHQLSRQHRTKDFHAVKTANDLDH